MTARIQITRGTRRFPGQHKFALASSTNLIRRESGEYSPWYFSCNAVLQPRDLRSRISEIRAAVNCSRETRSTLRSRETRHPRRSWFFYSVRPTSSSAAVYCRVLTPYRWREVSGRLARQGTKGFSLPLAPSLLHASGSFEVATVGYAWHGTGKTCLTTCDGNANAIIRGWLRFLSFAVTAARAEYFIKMHTAKNRSITYSRLREFVHVFTRVHVFTCPRRPQFCRGPECVMFTRLVCDGRVSARPKKWPAVISRKLNGVESEYCLGRGMDTNCRASVDAIGHAF